MTRTGRKALPFLRKLSWVVVRTCHHFVGSLVTDVMGGGSLVMGAAIFTKVMIRMAQEAPPFLRNFYSISS